MGTLRYNFRSEALGMHTDITITYPSGQYTYYQPDPTEKGIGPFRRAQKQYQTGMKFPTAYILHGGGDDDSLLHRYTRLEFYADRNNVMTVTAQAHDSFFLDTEYGIAYYTYITEELPVVVRALFASSSKREDNFVVGMAMGGNAALMAALRRPDLYAACVDLSGGIGCSVDSDYFVEQFQAVRMKKLHSAFPPTDRLLGSPVDLGSLARKHCEKGTKLPEFYMAVGEEDFIRDVVRKDRDAMRALGIALHYEEAKGLGHEWDFWDKYMEKTFDEWLPLRR